MSIRLPLQIKLWRFSGKNSCRKIMPAADFASTLAAVWPSVMRMSCSGGFIPFGVKGLL